MKEDNNIEELFRSSFGEFEVAPPPAVKQAVDRAIAAAPWYRRGWLWLLLLIPVAGIALFSWWNGMSGSGQDDSSPQTASGTVVSGSDPGSSQHTASGKSGGDNTHTASAGNDGGPADGSSPDASHNNEGAVSSGVNDSASDKQRISGGRGPADRASGTRSGSKKRRGGGNRSGVYSSAGSQDPVSSGNNGGNNGGNSGGSSSVSGDPLALNDGGKPQPGDNSDPNGVQQDPKQDPPKQDTPKQDPPQDTPKNDPPKTDSVPKPWKPDSTVKESLPGHNNKKKDDTGEKLWYASIYPGPQLSFNSSAPAGYTLDERSSFRFSGEINRSVINGYGLTSGFGYHSWSETFGFRSETYDSTYAYMDSIPVYDPQNPDSILYYDTVAVYDYDTTVFTSDQQTTVRTFFIPLYVSKQFAFNDNWGMLVNAGAVFNFYKVTRDSLTMKDFGMTLSGRVHATYKWKNWMFSAGVGGGWDLGVPASYANYDRKRYWITPQVGVHLRF